MGNPGPRSALSRRQRIYRRACRLYLAAFKSMRGVDPAMLFDEPFYLAENPDVASSPYPALFHYLRYGSRENRRPHPLFDPVFYLAHNPEAAFSGTGPLAHFLAHGSGARQPHRFFDAAYYLAGNPEVAAAGANPLVHFLARGAAEGRSPHPLFDTAGYLARNPDIAGSGVNPLLHYLAFGAAEGRDPRPREAAGRVKGMRPRPPERDVDIVIPLAREGADSRGCRESIARAICRRTAAVVETRDVDAAIARHPERDIVLLSPHARVGNDWLDRLAACAYELPRAATASPFSNHSGLCHYQSPGNDYAALDHVFAEVNRGRSAALPSPSFCTYIRRDSIAAAGPYSGPGFWTRALARGWTHRLAADVFVYDARGEVASDAAASRDPRYVRLLDCYRRIDPPNFARCAVTAQRIGASGRGPVLLVQHSGDRPTGVFALVLSPDAAGRVLLECTEAEYRLCISLDPRLEYDELLEILRRSRLARIRIRSLLPGLERLQADVGVPFDIDIGDAPRRGPLDAASSRVEYNRLLWSAERVETGSPRLERVRRSRAPVDLREPGRIAVVAVPSTTGTGQIEPCGYIRVVLPLEHPSLAGSIKLELASPEAALGVRADILLVERTSVTETALAEALLHHCRRTGMTPVYEIDDDLFGIPEDHPEYAMYAGSTAGARVFAAGAARVLVSTEALRRRLSAWNPDVLTVPNALDEQLWGAAPECPATARGDVLRVLYMGTPSHAGDLPILEEPFRRLRRRYGDRVQLDVLGVTNGAARPWFNRVTPAPGSTGSYPAFVRWLREQPAWDIGAAPLRDSGFNAAKSCMKYLDYAALGLPSVFSDAPAFAGVVRHGHNGLLAANDADSWYDALRSLVEDGALRASLAAACRADLPRHTLAGQAAFRRRLWARIPAAGAGLRQNTAMI